MLSEPICLRVKGPFACFTRPEFHVERVSYPVITPSAARGILEAILMKPIEKPCADQRGNGVGFRWRIKKLGVINKGYLMPMLRNEVGYQEHKKEAFESASTSPRVRSQRHSLILCGGSESGGARKPLDYLIEAVIDLDPEHAQRTGRQRPDPANARKYFEMFKRRATSGQCFYHPFFGCREFSVNEWGWVERNRSSREWELPAADKQKMGAIDGFDNGYFGSIFWDYDYNPVWDFWGYEGGTPRPENWRKDGVDPRRTRPAQLGPLNALAVKGWITVEP